LKPAAVGKIEKKDKKVEGVGGFQIRIAVTYIQGLSLEMEMASVVKFDELNLISSNECRQ